MLAQHACSQCVKRSQHHLFDHWPDQLGDTPLHFPCCLIGEGYCQNIPRGSCPASNQLGKTCGQHTCLPCTCARQDQQRTIQGGYSICLLLIQPLQPRFGHSRWHKSIGRCCFFTNWSHILTHCPFYLTPHQIPDYR